VRANATSVVLKPGPTTLLRGAVPKVNGEGSANADVSNQRSGVR
jgi:hypothetical protein